MNTISRNSTISVELQTQLNTIIENSQIKTVFQPIVSLRNGSILGYEALSRGPENSPLHNPDALFDTAMQCNKLWDLELLCRTKALESAYRHFEKIKLFINVNPHIIHDEKFVQGFTKEYLKTFNIDPENIFFEITEKNAVEDMEGFKKTIKITKNKITKLPLTMQGLDTRGLT